MGSGYQSGAGRDRDGQDEITAAVVDGMQPGDVVWDAEVRGFGLRYRARDRIYVVKTRIRGEQRILTIGRHGKGAWGAESARREAIRLLGLVRDGKDPAAERDADKVAPTLAALADRYLVNMPSLTKSRAPERRTGGCSSCTCCPPWAR